MPADPIVDIPTDAGVYRFVDLDGDVAYVGQSGTSLRGRLRQHFIRQDSSVAAQGRLDPWDISHADWWRVDADTVAQAEQALIAADQPYLNFEDASQETLSVSIDVTQPDGTFHLLNEEERAFRQQPYNRAKQKLAHLDRMVDKIKFADHSEQTRATLYEHQRILQENLAEFLGVENI